MPSNKKESPRKGKDLKIAIVGLGYVGLPTAVLFAEAGFNVTGCEMKKESVRMINDGISPLTDLNLDERVKDVVARKKLVATSDTVTATKENDVIIIIVPTPTKEGEEPDLSYIEGAGRDIANGLLRRHHLIERMLTEIFGLEWYKVHDEAEQLEHAVSADFERKLMEKLGTGTDCPHGNQVGLDSPDHRRRRGLKPLDEARPGESLLVAPVVGNALEREVYLPEGEWYSYWSGQRHDGKQSIKVAAPLEQIPIFVKSGTLLPLAQPTLHTAHPASYWLTAQVYGAGSASALVYDDEGSAPAALSEVRLNWDASSKAGSVHREGPPHTPQYKVIDWITIA